VAPALAAELAAYPATAARRSVVGSD
jgi:hypothetical protein